MENYWICEWTDDAGLTVEPAHKVTDESFEAVMTEGGDPVVIRLTMFHEDGTPDFAAFAAEVERHTGVVLSESSGEDE